MVDMPKTKPHQTTPVKLHQKQKPNILLKNFSQYFFEFQDSK